MINEFKDEFKNINTNGMVDIINRCAHQDILQAELAKTIQTYDTFGLYSINYIEDEKYGFWAVQWGWSKVDGFLLGGGHFKFGLKITPFKIEFEKADHSLNPFVNVNNRKNLEDYIQIFIYKNCPHYKKAIKDETNQFLKKLDLLNDENTQ